MYKSMQYNITAMYKSSRVLRPNSVALMATTTMTMAACLALALMMAQDTHGDETSVQRWRKMLLALGKDTA
jgi:hypothetical protein